jgi:hypothetical protein
MQQISTAFNKTAPGDCYPGYGNPSKNGKKPTCILDTTRRCSSGYKNVSGFPGCCNPAPDLSCIMNTSPKPPLPPPPPPPPPSRPSSSSPPISTAFIKTAMGDCYPGYGNPSKNGKQPTCVPDTTRRCSSGYMNVSGFPGCCNVGIDNSCIVPPKKK